MKGRKSGTTSLLDRFNNWLLNLPSLGDPRPKDMSLAYWSGFDSYPKPEILGNPYPEGTQEFSDWDKGWHDAEYEALLW